MTETDKAAWSDARDLLRQAYIWADTRGEPPRTAVEIVACALVAAMVEGLREASGIVQDVPLNPLFDLRNGEVTRVCGFCANVIDARISALTSDTTDAGERDA